MVIPTDLEMLRKCQLHEEHVNAGRTKLCLKVQKDDLGLLKKMIDSVEDASAATAGFFQLHLESVEELKKQFNYEETLLQLN
ncbi:hypothetical protein FD755_002917 [Muntiacus reevesi]|uniref:Uncharacterized protein n=1 Tax=Muntiacus reevesi TaxID=9886 RepID=A0A5J5N5J1_MUNRE|nr:hypothetical protein FD755_002917 [Muntiacus reevesi]